MNWIGVQRNSTASRGRETELAGVGALIGRDRGFFKLASAARLLLMAAAWPKQRIDEKDVGRGDTAEQAAAGWPL
jgi:hypothetical protein